MAHYLIEFLITVIGSCLGVLGAFMFDNLREEEDQRRKKKNLINALITEVKDLRKYIDETKMLQPYQTYSLEALVLEGTVQAQIDCIKNTKLIISLSILRSYFKRVHLRFERLDHIRIQKAANENGAFDKEIMAITDNWKAMRQKGLESLDHILPLLEKELP
jgi:hypothetical protein